jgi:hypothetical protein
VAAWNCVVVPASSVFPVDFAAEDQIVANPGSRYALFGESAYATDDRLETSSSVRALRDSRAEN